jgi:hypothetical protein
VAFVQIDDNYWRTHLNTQARGHMVKARIRERIEQSCRTGKTKPATQVTVRLWIQSEELLREYADIRGVSFNKSIANLVEQVMMIWNEYPGDPYIYLKRCEDPWHADGFIDLSSNVTTPFIRDPHADIDFRARQMADGMWGLLDSGVPEKQLLQEQEKIVRAWKVKRVETEKAASTRKG